MPDLLQLNELISQLRRVGVRPPQQLVDQILAFGEAAVQPLFQLATDRQSLMAGGERLLGPIHALRLLGELRSPTIVGPLLELFPLEEELYPFGDQLLALWEREVPQIIARVGAAARDELWATARNAELPDWRRHVAIGSLSHLVTLDESLHDEVAAGLRQILTDDSDPVVIASAIAGLGLLHVREAYPQVMEAYKAKRVDTGIISPGMARQMLLAKRTEGFKSCAGHPLWERYDEHGPTETDAAGQPHGHQAVR